MEIVVGLTCASLEAVLEAGWARAVLHQETRRNPFTNEVQEFTVWRGEERGEVRNAKALQVHPLARDVLSDPKARETADFHRGVMHDGMLFELWARTVGVDAAREAWRPSFRWPGNDYRSLFRFPSLVVASLANAAAQDVAETWASSPYFSDFFGSTSPQAAFDLACVTIDFCRSADHEVFAVTDGYISA